MIFTILYVPESPKFLYSLGRFDEARASLLQVALINGTSVDLEKNHPYE